MTTKRPIVRTSRLYLESWGYADERRFIRLFRETWRQIPLACRRRIAKYWRQSDNAPRVAVLDWYSDWYRGNSGCALAQCANRGRELTFRAAWVDHIPDACVRALVAHELAHVFEIIREPDYLTHDYFTVESWADETAESWGFDIEAYHGFAGSPENAAILKSFER